MALSNLKTFHLTGQPNLLVMQQNKKAKLE